MRRENGYRLHAFWDDGAAGLEPCVAELGRVLAVLRGTLGASSFFAELGDAGDLRPCASADDLAGIVESGSREFVIGHPRRAGRAFHVILQARLGESQLGVEATLGVELKPTNLWIPNNLQIDLPLRPDTEALLTASTMRALAEGVVRAVRPDWATVRTRYAPDVPVLLDGSPNVGWMTYLARRYGRLPPLPEEATSHRIDALGTLIIAHAGAFDDQRDDHLAAIEAVVLALADQLIPAAKTADVAPPSALPALEPLPPLDEPASHRVEHAAKRAVQAIPVSPAACGTRLWRVGGRLHVTVVVKAELAFAHESKMVLVPAAAVVADDEHEANDPRRSVRVPGELAPYLGMTDVLFTGSAHAPVGQSVSAMSVRIAIGGDRLLLDKTVHVYGDCRATAAPAPFMSMPLSYERAIGGSGDNPVGVTPGGGVLPNLVSPVRPNRPAGFGPIARSWPIRSTQLGPVSREQLDRRIAEIPDGLDWSYFQAAPRDQRIEGLAGDETIALDGLHPSLPRVVLSLPGIAAHARAYHVSAGRVSAPYPIALRLDTLRIDGERQRCTLLWRGSFPVRDEAALEELRITGGVTVSGAPMSWPDEVLGYAAIDAELPPRHEEPGASTAAMSAEQQAEAAAAAAVPFGLGPGARSAPLRPAPIPGAPWSDEPAEAPAPALDRQATTMLLRRGAPAPPPAERK